MEARVRLTWMAAVLVLMFAVSVLWPQPGYIHPDEFFQSTEVLAGNIFNISHLRTWEFQSDAPLRDITMPYLLFAPGFYVLRWLLSTFVSRYVAESYAVVVIPRVTLALAGLLNLFLVQRLCLVFALNQGRAMWLWLTSYVTWTFLTRPFSNTSEMLLLSALLLLLLETLQQCRHSVYKLKASEQLGRESSSSDQRSNPRRERLSTQQLTNKMKLCSFLLGAMLCMGFFNRPTFGVFVFAPLMWWVDQVSLLCKKQAVIALLSLSVSGFLLTFAVMSLTNSFYYNSDFRHLLKELFMAFAQWNFDAILQSGREVVAGLRIPPWSFVRYNLLDENLSEHGLHPWYTHLLLHLPTLLGPLALVLFADVAMLVVHWRQTHCTDVLYFMILTPIISLSFFPHQEARFLLPVLPLVVVSLASHSWLDHSSVKAVVLLFNLLGMVIFGWLHQGGVVPALSALQSHLKDMSEQPSNQHIRHHIIAYSTYMLPRQVLFSDSSSVEVHVHDMIGAHNHPPTLRFRMDQLHYACLEDSMTCRFWVLMPAPALQDLSSMEGWERVQEWGGEFCPHMSVERLPAVASLKSWDDMHHLLSQLCLKIVSVVI